MKTVCSWCDTVIREGAEPVSHGCCAECAETLLPTVRHVDYTILFEPTIRLTLEHEGSGNYIVVDGDTVYMRSPDLELCVRFMLAMQAKKEAAVDVDSIIWFRLLRNSGHSIRVPTLDAGEATPWWDDGTSPASNVHPIRKAESA